MRGQAITTVSDVYSLGVLLYELLTGEPPYKLETHTADEITKAICEQQPQRPSIAAAKGDVSSRLQLGQGGPNSKLLRGDLDNIVLKALSKEPARRYQSVDLFSEDIRRHLAGLPVRARKDTAAYRTSRFVRRHKVSVLAAALIVLALIGGSITTAWQAHRARLERAIAEERFNEVRAMAHAVMFDYHDAIATLPGSTAVRERMVKDSLNYLDQLSKQAGNDGGLLREIASAYLKVGDVQGRPFNPNLGDLVGANESYGKSLAIRQQLSELEPNNSGFKEELGTSYERFGALNIPLGKPAVAVQNLQKAIAIYDELLRGNPTSRPIRGELALLYQWMGVALGESAVINLGDTKRALDYQRKSLALLEPLVAEEPTNLTYRQYLGSVYPYIADLLISSDQAAALNNYRKALAVHQALVEQNPRNTFFQRELAVNYSNICNLLRKMGDDARSLENGRQALALFEKMAAADPNDANISKDLAIMHQNIGASLNKMNDHAAALDHYQASLRILEELSTRNATDTDVQLRREWGYLKLSELLSATGDSNGAIVNAQKARHILETLIAATPKNTLATTHLALVYGQLGKCYAAKAAWHEARDWDEKSLALYQDMKAKGTLAPSDAKKPDELIVEIAKCDAAIK